MPGYLFFVCNQHFISRKGAKTQSRDAVCGWDLGYVARSVSCFTKLLVFAYNFNLASRKEQKQCMLYLNYNYEEVSH
jgi:hypothetical protein